MAATPMVHRGGVSGSRHHGNVAAHGSRPDAVIGSDMPDAGMTLTPPTIPGARKADRSERRIVSRQPATRKLTAISPSLGHPDGCTGHLESNGYQP